MTITCKIFAFYILFPFHNATVYEPSRVVQAHTAERPLVGVLIHDWIKKLAGRLERKLTHSQLPRCVAGGVTRI